MKKFRTAAALTVALVAGIGLAWAQAGAGPTMQHQGMHQPDTQQPGTQQHDAAASPSTTAYRAAMDSMMHAMDIAYTGDADRDFVAGMLPHHQGAVAMAEVELRYGHDPELRQLAQDIIAAQQKEIAFLIAWKARQR